MHIQGDVWQLLSSTGFGGIESQTFRWARVLQRRGIAAKVVLMDGGEDHPLVLRLRQAGLSVDVLPNGSAGLWRKIRQEKPALVHSRGYKAGILGRLLCRLSRIPVVSHFHNGEPGVGRLRLYSWLDDHTAFLAPAMAVSRQIADRIPACVQVTNNFVDLPDDASCFGGKTVAFVGRLSWEKGADVFCRIAAQFPDKPFHIFGDGPERACLETQWQGSVCFHGAVPSMEAHWPDIGLLVMPSRHEGLPNAALEAMARGIPVAAFDVGGLSRLVKNAETGWLLPPGQEDMMLSAITDWMTMNPDRRRRMSKQARRHIRQHFSEHQAVPQILTVYQQALAGA